MGRPTNGVPYLKGGVYHIRFKGDKDATSLETKSESVAKQRAKSISRARGETGPSSRSALATPIVSSPEKPAVVMSGGGGPPAGALTTDPLADWQSGESVFDGSDVAGGRANGNGASHSTDLAGSGSGESSQNSDDRGGWVRGLSPAKPWELEPGKKGLSLEEKERMHGLLAGVVGRVNILAVGLGVRIFGRIPAEPEPADTELLNKAWEMQLADLLANKELTPAIMICAASVGLGVGMWANGEAKPKKEKEPDGSQAHTAPLGG